jgi:allantoinase
MLLQSNKWSLVCTIVLHPFVIGQPFRLSALCRALTHIAARRDDLWITTPGAVASHFATVVPAPAG